MAKSARLLGASAAAAAVAEDQTSTWIVCWRIPAESSFWRARRARMMIRAGDAQGARIFMIQKRGSAAPRASIWAFDPPQKNSRAPSIAAAAAAVVAAQQVDYPGTTKTGKPEASNLSRRPICAKWRAFFVESQRAPSIRRAYFPILKHGRRIGGALLEREKVGCWMAKGEGGERKVGQKGAKTAFENRPTSSNSAGRALESELAGRMRIIFFRRALIRPFAGPRRLGSAAATFRRGAKQLLQLESGAGKSVSACPRRRRRQRDTHFAPTSLELSHAKRAGITFGRATPAAHSSPPPGGRARKCVFSTGQPARPNVLCPRRPKTQLSASQRVSNL